MVIIPTIFVVRNEGFEYLQTMELYAYIVRLLQCKFLCHLVMNVVDDSHSRFLRFRIWESRQTMEQYLLLSPLCRRLFVKNTEYGNSIRIVPFQVVHHSQ